MHIQASGNIDYAPRISAIDTNHTSYSTGNEYHQDAYVAAYLDNNLTLRLSFTPDEARDFAQRLLVTAAAVDQMNADHDCGATSNGGLVPTAAAV